MVKILVYMIIKTPKVLYVGFSFKFLNLKKKL
jgi:hypothetical protein